MAAGGARRPWTPGAGDMRFKGSIKVPNGTMAARWEGSDANVTTLGPFRAAYRTRPMGRAAADSGTIGLVQYEVFFRYQAALKDVSEKARILIDGKTLEVAAIDPLDGTRRWLKFVCEAINQGTAS